MNEGARILNLEVKVPWYVWFEREGVSLNKLGMFFAELGETSSCVCTIGIYSK